MRRPVFRREGFALPVALLAMMLIGVVVTAGFYASSFHVDQADSGELASRAFYVAEFGLDETVGTWSSDDYDRIAAYRTLDETEVETADGGRLGAYELHVARLGPHLFLVASTGRVRQGSRASDRRVATLVRTTPVRLPKAAALTVVGAVRVEDGARIDGAAVDDESCRTAGDAAGIAAPRAASVSAPEGTVDGAPAIAQDEGVDVAAAARFGALDIDELRAAADRTLEGDIALRTLRPATAAGDDACEAEDPRNWGDPSGRGPCAEYRPIVHVTGDAELGGGVGQGILIVDGDLTVDGSFSFHGVVVVGGSLRTTGAANRIEGAVIVLGAGPETGVSRVGAGTTIRYSACAVERALARLARPRPLTSRAWIDLRAAAAGWPEETAS